MFIGKIGKIHKTYIFKKRSDIDNINKFREKIDYTIQFREKYENLRREES